MLRFINVQTKWDILPSHKVGLTPLQLLFCYLSLIIFGRTSELRAPLGILEHLALFTAKTAFPEPRLSLMRLMLCAPSGFWPICCTLLYQRPPYVCLGAVTSPADCQETAGGKTLWVRDFVSRLDAAVWSWYTRWGGCYADQQTPSLQCQISAWIIHLLVDERVWNIGLPVRSEQPSCSRVSRLPWAVFAWFLHLPRWSHSRVIIRFGVF